MKAPASAGCSYSSSIRARSKPGNVRHVGQAASRFLATLSFADRSALMLLPSGPNVTFTWAHDKVRDALGRVIGQAGHDNAFEFGSLTEAREISNRSQIALRTVAQRECGSGAAASAGLDAFGGGSGGLGGQSTPSGGGGTQGGAGLRWRRDGRRWRRRRFRRHPGNVVGWLGYGTTVERRRIRQQLHP